VSAGHRYGVSGTDFKVEPEKSRGAQMSLPLEPPSVADPTRMVQLRSRAVSITAVHTIGFLSSSTAYDANVGCPNVPEGGAMILCHFPRRGP
jgi:hypothetical protein